jgi:hypothetical protein
MAQYTPHPAQQLKKKEKKKQQKTPNLYEKGRNIMAYQYMIILWQFPFCVFQC